MNKRLITIAIILNLSGLLAGCQSQVTTTAKTYRQVGIVATIKGHTAAKTIKYRIENKAIHTATVHNHSFVVSVAPTTHQQTVTLSASNTPQHKVTVQAATPLGNYHRLAQRYNQIITTAQLSPKQQHQLQTATQLKQTPQAAQSLLSQTSPKSRALQFPAYHQGVHSLIKTANYTLRGNMQENQLMGVTMIVPLHSLKNKQAARQFGTAFMALSQACGANGKQVLQSFKRVTNHQKTQQTTLKTITNHGVHYQVAFSPNGLYVYVTR